jgi:glycosyltransferase involved in cell wall biosynthesis
MTRPRITHLVDDTTAGGIMRVLDHLQTDPRLAALGQHCLRPIPRSGAIPACRDADVIVSHLSINWRRLPAFVHLRATHAHLPLVHVEHSYTEAFVARTVPNRGRFRTLLATAYSLFDRVVAVSEAQGAWLTERGLIPPEALSVIPSCVDLGPFLHLTPALNAPRIIGAIGRLDPQKGFDTLITAMRATCTPGLRLEVFGDGPERARLEALAAGDPRIRFRGWVDPVVALSQVDAVAMPSRWEAYGLVGLEARAAGRPLLAARTDGLRDQIAEGAIPVDGTGTAAWTRALDHLATGAGAADTLSARQTASGACIRFANGWSDLIAGLRQQEPVQQAA